MQENVESKGIFVVHICGILMQSKDDRTKARIAAAGRDGSTRMFMQRLKRGNPAENAWLKNHVMLIAATVTPALPACFLCRTAKMRGIKSNCMLNRY